MGRKETCPECGRLARPRCFRFNIVSKKKICRICDRRIGHNIFYSPEIKGAKKKQRFIKMTMTEEEKKDLWGSLVRIGLSEERARERVINTQNHLWRYQRKRMWQPRITREEQDKLELNRKLIEGLMIQQ